MFKKSIAVGLCIALILCLFAGCSGTLGKKDGISIVCTVFPQYDWVMSIMGTLAQKADITLLTGSGADMHSYQSSAADIVKVSSCDLFIYVGGQSDSWVQDALKNSVNPDMISINMIEVLGDRVYEEETLFESEHSEEHEHQFESEKDEHVWLSLKNAEIICTSIKDALCTIDAQNKSTYEENFNTYCKALKALDSDYAAAVNAAKNKVLLVCDRFPFRYLTEDYGLDYYAAFPGCSAESEASFETVAFLAQKINELKIKTVVVTETSDKSLANTIINNTADKNQAITVLNAMQAVGNNEIATGQTYIKIMTDNLSSLKIALG